jgi:hypothetical protein
MDKEYIREKTGFQKTAGLNSFQISISSPYMEGKAVIERACKFSISKRKAL